MRTYLVNHKSLMVIGGAMVSPVVVVVAVFSSFDTIRVVVVQAECVLCLIASYDDHQPRASTKAKDVCQEHTYLWKTGCGLPQSLGFNVSFMCLFTTGVCVFRDNGQFYCN